MIDLYQMTAKGLKAGPARGAKMESVPDKDTLHFFNQVRFVLFENDPSSGFLLLEAVKGVYHILTMRPDYPNCLRLYSSAFTVSCCSLPSFFVFPWGVAFGYDEERRSKGPIDLAIEPGMRDEL